MCCAGDGRALNDKKVKTQKGGKVCTKTAHKVVVIGHRNPDTDSICSAIAYAELKNKTSDLVCEARRAGKMNQETEFVLKKFGVTPPRMCTDVNPKIRDVDYREMPGIPGTTSLRKAWEIMRDKQIDTLPVTSPDNELEGVITVKDIATANMDVFDTGILAKSQHQLPQYSGNAGRLPWWWAARTTSAPPATSALAPPRRKCWKIPWKKAISSS